MPFSTYTHRQTHDIIILSTPARTSPSPSPSPHLVLQNSESHGLLQVRLHVLQASDSPVRIAHCQQSVPGTTMNGLGYLLMPPFRILRLLFHS